MKPEAFLPATSLEMWEARLACLELDTGKEEGGALESNVERWLAVQRACGLEVLY